MTTKHTPGPWSRNIKPAKKYNTIFAGRNTHVCHLTVTGLTDEEIEANCDLIRAAPELLDALSDLMKSCANWAPTIDRSRARAALRKAGAPCD